LIITKGGVLVKKKLLRMAILEYTSFMKKAKKHQFSHVDPETVKKGEKITTKSSKTVEKKEDTIPTFVYRDLGRTTYIIAGFLVLLAALYLIQIKTNWLAPVLKFFGI
jgi:hypothetical protein